MLSKINFKKGEHYSADLVITLDYEQTLSRDIPPTTRVYFFNHDPAIGYFALYLCVVLTCRAGMSLRFQVAR